MPQDSELFQLCYGPVRHEEACSELFAKYHKPACRFARCFLNNPLRAEDIVQNAWLSLSRQKEFKNFENFRGYFFQTVKNFVFDYSRKSEVRHSKNHISLDDNVSDSLADPDPLTWSEVIGDEKAEEERIIRDLINSLDAILQTYLSPRAYLAFRFTMLDGNTLDETAQILQCAKRTVQRDIDEAFKIIDRYMDLFF